MIIDCISFALPCTLWALVNEYDMTTCLVVKTFFNCFSETLKAGVTLNIIFPPLSMALMETSRSRLKQSKNSLLIT